MDRPLLDNDAFISHLTELMKEGKDAAIMQMLKEYMKSTNQSLHQVLAEFFEKTKENTWLKAGSKPQS